ncbi:LysR substrate-binding domain-containing protein [Methylocella sp. CPCC 101449]|jgi:DNA-binding transcriptional LysR family regulator|uniref:LysR family transcriptional regulator n=1 Tax=Methylocella sp. CPCC 101449 TaxID=2987531 RepID=UPI00288FDF90|nr:LysR substrate-binding domain-containing protein [Methylocella sp. CPCC 101449]MDT2021923.1 LysR substrate-binding domain-containing protein [Methylocella sp. CPCC 101449]HEV2572031.1 LysR substrate-binding domain-containing protein [Beijerinckiaceae bacterium]
MDFLAALGAFVRVAQSHSFSRAAEELDVTQSRISKQIALLEARLDVRLLSRTTRRVRLTEEGSRFLTFALRMLDDLAEVEAQIGSGKGLPSGLVKIGSPSAFARRYLVESANRILAKYPALRLEIVTGDLAEDLVEQGIDMAIRFGTVSGSMIAKRVGNFPRVVVASPDYLKHAGEPTTLEALASHQCLIYLNPDAGSDWAFATSSGRRRIAVTGRLQSNNADVVKQACLSGAGIALMPEWFFQDEIGTGQVKRLLPQFRPDGLTVTLAYVSRSFLPPKIRIVLDALSADLRGIIRAK